MSDIGLLDEYRTRAELADELRCSWRTIWRYENQPDGLPSVLIAGRKFYRIESVRDWLNKRERRPNPRRVA
jgi:hypothetical protein